MFLCSTWSWMTWGGVRSLAVIMPLVYLLDCYLGCLVCLTKEVICFDVTCTWQIHVDFSLPLHFFLKYSVSKCNEVVSWSDGSFHPQNSKNICVILFYQKCCCLLQYLNAFLLDSENKQCRCMEAFGLLCCHPKLFSYWNSANMSLVCCHHSFPVSRNELNT